MRHYRPGLDRLAAASARAVCALAAIDVPGYRDFLRRHGTGRHRRLADFPETSKDRYVARYDQLSRCWRGPSQCDRVGLFSLRPLPTT